MILFIGNCQTASLCFYFQELGYQAQWLLYGEEFRPHLGSWSYKVNKVFNMDVIKDSDIIVFQEVCQAKSTFCNRAVLQKLAKPTCQFIMLPSIHMDYTHYQESIEELRRREIENNVDIIVTDLFEKYKDRKLMLTISHPTTFFFLKLVKRLCNHLGLKTFSKEKKNMFLQDNNYMKLP
jgi:hypothetical protein